MTNSYSVRRKEARESHLTFYHYLFSNQVERPDRSLCFRILRRALARLVSDTVTSLFTIKPLPELGLTDCLNCWQKRDERNTPHFSSSHVPLLLACPPTQRLTN